MINKEHDAILFFDSYCVLCNGMVNFLIKRDKRIILMYSSLQSDNAIALLPPQSLQEDTVVLYYKGDVFIKSDAAIKTCIILGGAWRVAKVFYIIPKSIRDGLYKWVARNRYKWFGRNEQCRIPNEKEKYLFLD